MLCVSSAKRKAICLPNALRTQMVSIPKAVAVVCVAINSILPKTVLSKTNGNSRKWTKDLNMDTHRERTLLPFLSHPFKKRVGKGITKKRKKKKIRAKLFVFDYFLVHKRINVAH